MKVLMKDAKLAERIGRKHKTDHSSPTGPTNALTVQAIMELRIVQQDSNHMQPPLATQLTVQVFTKMIHNLKIIPPQQHSQQSASTMSISTPTLMVNNPLQTGPQQGQQQHPPPQIPPASQPANSPIRHNQFNQKFQQPPMPQ